MVGRVEARAWHAPPFRVPRSVLRPEVWPGSLGAPVCPGVHPSNTDTRYDQLYRGISGDAYKAAGIEGFLPHCPFSDMAF